MYGIIIIIRKVKTRAQTKNIASWQYFDLFKKSSSGKIKQLFII